MFLYSFLSSLQDLIVQTNHSSGLPPRLQHVATLWLTIGLATLTTEFVSPSMVLRFRNHSLNPRGNL